MFADDAFVALGVVCGWIGVYRLWPTYAWFYAGACLIGVGYVLGRTR